MERGQGSLIARLVWLTTGITLRSVNATYWNGTAVASPDTAGYPKVTIKSGTGTGELSLSSGVVTAQLQSTGLGVIKRIQYGTYTFSSGGTTATATLGNAVVVASTYLINLGFTVANGGANTILGDLPYITLTNTTTITATRASGVDGGGNNVTGTGSFVVVEVN